MSSLGVLLKLAPVDAKNIRRDSMLMWMPVIAALLVVAVRWGVPTLAGMIAARRGFDATAWYPLIMSSFAISLPGIVGAVVGFLLLDERDDGVLTALLVTPISANTYVAYRVGSPLAAAFVATMIAYPLVGLTPLAWHDLAAAAALGSFGAPFMALFLASFADNKVTGFALMKLINAVQILPLVAYAVAMPHQLLFGVLPAYWPMKIVWLAAAGQPYGAYLAAGFVVNVVAVGLLMRRFDRIVHR